jgi:hypothetical protein
MKIIQYYIPIYKRCDHPNELIDDFNYWVGLLMEIIK